MKRIIVLLSIILVIGIVFSPPKILAAQKGSPYLYAFVQQDENDTIKIRAIDPTNPAAITDLLTTSVTPDLSLQAATPSPDGKWIALALSSRGGEHVRLANVLTNEVRDMPVELFYAHDAPSYFLDQRVAWSPNSRYLAYIGYQNEASDVYLYNIEDGTLTNLTKDAAFQYRLAWVQDSSRMAVLTQTCSTTQNCTDTIDIFDMGARTRQSSILIRQFQYTINGGAICRIEWSPNGQYISFQNDCRGSALGSSKELYFITVSSQKITRLTSFTPPLNSVPVESPNFILFAQYAVIWFDAQTLLVGVHYLADDASRTNMTKTLAYTIPTASSTTLSASMAREWALNPQTHEVAFLASIFDPDGYAARNPTIRVATFDGSSLKTTLSLPDGCDLAWSPDGAFLGYTDRGHPLERCSNLRGFIFVEKANGQVREHKLSIDQRSNRVVIAGWIRNKAVPIVTPMPTFTPARTLTPGR